MVSSENPQWVVQAGLQPKIELAAHSKPVSEHCQIEAADDLEAVHCWLQHYRSNLNTYKAYAKESKRFLLWCVYEKGLSLGELKAQDFEQYFRFLKMPPAYWCAEQINPKKKYQNIVFPLKKGLSESACRMSIRAINSLMNYLVNADYLRSNPIKLLRTSLVANIDMEVHKYKVWERMLEQDEWAAVQKSLQEMPVQNSKEIDNKARTQFLFALLYLLGLRINEVANASWNAFRKHNGAWWFFIKGKGGKLGHIPVNEQLLSYVKVYRLHLGLVPLPSLDETGQMLVSRKSKRPLKIRQLYGLVKAIGIESAKSFRDRPLKQKKLEQLSPHWLRHLSASHQDRAGIPATVIQANHRHSSNQTTQIYLHAEDELRVTEIQKLKMDLEPQSLDLVESAKSANLKIKLKGSSISGRLNLAKLLNSIELNIFKNHAWKRKEMDTDLLLDRYEQLKRFGMVFDLEYILELMSIKELQQMKQLINREAGIRLFDCEFE